MNEGFEKSIKLFLLWWFLYLATLVTGSIIPGLIIHVTNNSLTAIDLSNQTNSLYLIILVIGLVLLAYGVWWFGKKFTE